MSERKRNRREFTAEFKDEAVRLALSKKQNVSEVARELGISTSVLHNWVVAHRQANGGDESEPLTEVRFFRQQEELRKLREENERLREERDILKKAIAYCVKESK